MPSVVVPLVLRCLLLCFAFVAQPSEGFLCSPETLDHNVRNGFVHNAEQLCRPFRVSQNTQVVRVIYLTALPGELPDTIKVQAQACTGVAIGLRTVLTARHCVEGGKRIGGFIRTLLGGLHPVRFYSPDPEEDITMLTIADSMGVQPAEIAPRGEVSSALRLEGYGCLPQLELLPLHGVDIEPLQRQATARYVIGNALYLSGCVCHGDSGGPVFDDQGRLVALMVRTDNEGRAGRGLLVHDFLNAP